MKNFFLVLLAAVGLLGCSKNDLPDYNVLGGLRVLAVKAASPELSPGDVTTVTPVVSDIAGAGRVLSYTATGCPDPGVGLGATPSCEGSPMSVTLGTGTFVPTAPSFTQIAPSFTVTIPSELLDTRSPLDQFNGITYLITYDVRAVNGEMVSTFKRLIVSSATSKPQKNLNPTLSGVLGAGAPLVALPATTTSLMVDGDLSASVQSYEVLIATGGSKTLLETLITTWFLSDGGLNHFRTVGGDVINFTPPDVLPTVHSVVLVAVMRDGRGGEDFWIGSF